MIEKERRQFQRVDFPLLVLFRGASNASFESAYAEDLSVGGLCVRGGTADMGALVDLQLVERDGRRPLEILAQVVRSEPDGFAARFVEVDPEQKLWLQEVVEQRGRQDLAGRTEDLLERSFDEL